MRQAEILDQLLIGAGLLQGVQIESVQVLHQRLLHTVQVGGISNDGGDGWQSGSLCRSPAPLAGDQLVHAVGYGSHQHGLEDADLADRGGKRGQTLFVKGRAGLMRVGPDGDYRDVE